jgi:hypothetical protein
MAKTVDITASYVGAEITLVDIYDVWPGGALLSGSFTGTKIKEGIRLTGISNSTFSFVLVDTATSASSAPKFLPGPTISQFNPTSGQAGSIIGITGSGLVGTTAVEIGLQPALFSVISNTNISASVPLDASGTNYILLSTPGGLAAKPGWSYEEGGGPVVFNLGAFIYGNTSTEACSRELVEAGFYSTDGNTIQAVFEVNGQVWTDQALTQAPSQGWYRAPNSFLTNPYLVYFINDQGYVVERTTCLEEIPLD